jgi:hypothetical protein
MAAGGLAGIGDAAFWAYRQGSIGWLWWVVAACVGAGVGALVWLAARNTATARHPMIGRYRVEGVLGAGSSGTVYRGVDPAGGGPVAIKVLALAWMADGEFRARFRDEALIMRSLDHPNCVSVHEVFDDEGLAAIVTDYVDGTSLRAVLSRAGRLDGPQAAAVMAGALRGLAHVHSRGMVHRDVKPENILVDRHGTSRLVDYGLARDVGSLGAGSEASVGSPAYMSPEQVRGDALDARSDVYACGAVLFELLTGHPPYTATSIQEMADAHLSAAVPNLSTVRPELPESLAALTMSSLAKRPSDRPASAEAFYQALEEAAEHAYGPGWAAGAAVGGLVAAAGVATTLGAGGAATTMGAVTSATAAGATSVTETTGTVAATNVPVAATNPTSGGGNGQPGSHPGAKAPQRHIPPSTRAGMPAIAGGSASKRLAGPAAAILTAVVVIATLLGANSTHKPIAVSFASCLPGAWVTEAATGDDVWKGAPVLVNNQGGSTVRFSTDGTFFSVDPPGEPPARGTLNGAEFIDTSYGVVTGRWRTTGEHTLIESALNRQRFAQTLYAGYEHVTSPGTPLQAGTITSTMTCSANALVIDNNFTYQGKQLTEHFTMRRVNNAPTAPPSSAIPDQSDALGGINLNSYCASQQVGALRAVTTKALIGPADASGNWACQGQTTTTPIDMTAACQWAYAVDQNVTARAIDPNSAASWFCYGGPPRTFTITPTSGGMGTSITLTSVTPCPSTTKGVTYFLAAASSQGQGLLKSGGDRPLPGGGAWSVTLGVSGALGAATSHNAARSVQVIAACDLPNNQYAEYQQMQFQFTGG